MTEEMDYQYQFALDENEGDYTNKPTYYNELNRRLKDNKCRTVLEGWFLWVPKREYRKVKTIDN